MTREFDQLFEYFLAHLPEARVGWVHENEPRGREKPGHAAGESLGQRPAGPVGLGQMVEVFERNGVSFASVTQQFNSTTSMGRLMLNVLLSFAQFEREMIVERTKMGLARRMKEGKWNGLAHGA